MTFGEVAVYWLHLVMCFVGFILGYFILYFVFVIFILHFLCHD